MGNAKHRTACREPEEHGGGVLTFDGRSDIIQYVGVLMYTSAHSHGSDVLCAALVYPGGEHTAEEAAPLHTGAAFAFRSRRLRRLCRTVFIRCLRSRP